MGGKLGFGVQHSGEWNGWLDWIMLWRQPGMTYWSSLGAVVVWTIFFTSLKKWKFLVVAEEIMLYLVILFLGMTAVDYISRGMKTAYLGWVLISLLLLVLVAVVQNRYRSFVWYTSGKKGFVFWWGLMFFGFLTSSWLVFTKSSWWLVAIPAIFGLTMLLELLILGDTFSLLSIKKGRIK